VLPGISRVLVPQVQVPFPDPSDDRGIFDVPDGANGGLGHTNCLTYGEMGYKSRHLVVTDSRAVFIAAFVSDVKDVNRAIWVNN
jgi:hypothetical protein